MKKKIFIYDFDGTLTPYPITKVEVLEECGFEGGFMSPKITKMINDRMLTKQVDLYTASYELLLEILKENKIPATRENFKLGATNIEYNPGVYEFLDKITSLGFENYMVSSSAKDFLNGTTVAKFFKKIYGTTFIFNEIGEAIKSDFLMSDLRKVDVIKTILEENGYFSNDCSDFVYVGDGSTDLYAMEYVKKHGGITVLVYLDEKNQFLNEAKELGVVSYFVKADYTEGSDLHNLFDKLCEKD